jgi:isopenicillin N synthase-like dioxygenase
VERFEREGRKFFQLPKEVKNSVRRSENNSRGYFDNELTKQKVDWKEGTWTKKFSSSLLSLLIPSSFSSLSLLSLPHPLHLLPFFPSFLLALSLGLLPSLALARLVLLSPPRLVPLLSPSFLRLLCVGFDYGDKANEIDGIDLWPKGEEEFKKAMLDYFQAVKNLSELILGLSLSSFLLLPPPSSSSLLFPPSSSPPLLLRGRRGN